MLRCVASNSTQADVSNKPLNVKALRSSDASVCGKFHATQP